MTRSAVLLVLLLAATACTRDDTKYPSLALRPIESRTDDAPDADATPAPTAADPTLDGQLTASTTTIDRNIADFATAVAKADAAARARGARTEGSDAWLGAQASLADLEALHGDLLGMAGDLDRVATDRAQAGAAPYPALDAAQAKAQSAVETQAARIAAIKASLGEK